MGLYHLAEQHNVGVWLVNEHDGIAAAVNAAQGQAVPLAGGLWTFPPGTSDKRGFMASTPPEPVMIGNWILSARAEGDGMVVRYGTHLDATAPLSEFHPWV
jgi:hypothetical protein